MMIDPLTHTQAPIIIRTHTHILAVAKALTDGLEIRDEVEDRVGLVVHKKRLITTEESQILMSISPEHRRPSQSLD